MSGQFHFYGAGEVRRYEASERAVTLVGHDAIIGLIQHATADETGATRQANVDWFPLDRQEQVVVFREQGNGRVVVFLESERLALFPTLPGPPG